MAPFEKIATRYFLYIFLSVAQSRLSENFFFNSSKNLLAFPEWFSASSVFSVHVKPSTAIQWSFCNYGLLMGLPFFTTLPYFFWFGTLYCVLIRFTSLNGQQLGSFHLCLWGETPLTDKTSKTQRYQKQFCMIFFGQRMEPNLLNTTQQFSRTVLVCRIAFNHGVEKSLDYVEIQNFNWLLMAFYAEVFIQL